jgi:hypothetical protein
MKRLNGRSIDVVTNVHRVVAVAWFAGALGALYLAATIMFGAGGAEPLSWARIAIFQRVATTASVVIVVMDVFYGLATAWHFFRHRLVPLKWVLFLAATAFGGISISAAKSRSAGAVVGLTVAELVMLLGTLSLGIILMRARRAGKLADRGILGRD